MDGWMDGCLRVCVYCVPLLPPDTRDDNQEWDKPDPLFIFAGQIWEEEEEEEEEEKDP